MATFLLDPADHSRHRRGWTASRIAVAALLAGTVLLGLASPASAQQPSVEGMLESGDSGDELEADTELPEPSVDDVNVNVQWQLFKQSLEDGEPGIPELDKMRADAVSVGRPSLPHHQLAILHQVREGPGQDLDQSDAFDLRKQAHDLAPRLPYAKFELARARLFGGFDAAIRALPAYLDGLQIGLTWLDTRISWGLKAALLLLMASGIAFLGFLLAQLLRYFGITAYDGTRILPRGFSSTQTVIVLVALVLVPGLLLQAPLLSMLLLLVLVIPFQRLNERLITIAFLAVLAALPWIDSQLGRLVNYPGSDAQEVLHAQYHDCDRACRDTLDDIAPDQHGVARYAERVALYRTGTREAMVELQDWFERTEPAADSDRLRAQWMNLRGAVLLARGESEEALALFEETVDLETEHPAPWFNQARAHQVLDNESRGHQAMRNAFRRDLAAVSRKADLSGREPNTFLMLQPVASTTIWKAHPPSSEQVPSLMAPVWTVLAGEELNLEAAFWLGLAGILLVVLTTPLYVQRRVSSPCPKCGLARDPTEAEETGHHHYCLPCYQTFVSGASLDYHARVHSEKTLGRRNRLQKFIRRALSAITPGLGHVQGGHAVRGTIAFGLLVTGVLVLLYPLGPTGAWRGAFELFRNHWAGQSVVAWLLISLGGIVGLNGLIYGIAAARVPDRPDDGKGKS